MTILIKKALKMHRSYVQTVSITSIFNEKGKLKTGTVQNPHGKDHSVFIAFAPKENPKIAVAVFVENAGFGGTWAAPIASLVIEKYIKGKIENAKQENRVLEANLLINTKNEKQ